MLKHNDENVCKSCSGTGKVTKELKDAYGEFIKIMIICPECKNKKIFTKEVSNANRK